ncbi:helix-turn-helix transcriptional regulator [Crocosphaera sp. UHCC 0190]|uniref:helix-turn-helix transcriptional regulator n=1 Tax=unclassified Crocosphaera TaxID=2623705 RepID=UPI002B1F13F4|nr:MULTISPECIES: helix-turn-helix transcriptional regulator [unclassified Crocosphaera]MEA5508665.1 helix-turn-helix transcriptional regulator [Crocosphaera sp. UHCC 0190]MEA5533682.1 helix-turn-helix transcriptional regulator [Crocosphaera sp. XPORK-15E]
MICNERQYGITKKRIREFELKTAELKSRSFSDNDENEKLRYELYLNNFESTLEELQEEVQEYEALKSGKIQQLFLDEFSKLPEALIKARIAKGLTQEQLAESLDLKPQQIQRYEATFYESASFYRILEVMDALNIKIKQEIILKKI